MDKPPKAKKLPLCKQCKQPFTKFQSSQIVCGYQCAKEYAEQKRVKEDAKKAQVARLEYRQAKVKLKTRGEYVEDAQRAFNAFIRARDKDLPCISCGLFRNGWDAGHYLPRSTRPELRFNEDNCHKQCKYDNNYNKGRAVNEYRPRLIERIGLERVLALEAPHPPAKWTIDDLKAIKAEYKLKLKGLNDATITS